MRPPECVLCGVKEDCDLVYFKKRRIDEAWHRRMKRIKGVGHPPEAEWFCSKHLKAAQNLKNETIGRAMRILEKKVN